MELKQGQTSRGFDRMVQGKIAANVLTVSILAIILMVFVNIGMSKLGESRDVRFDISGHRVASLEDATKVLLRRLDQPLEIYLVYGYDDRMREAAKPYAGARLPDQGILNEIYGRALETMVMPIRQRLDEARRYTPAIRVLEADIRAERDRPERWARELGVDGGRLTNHLIFRNPRNGKMKSFSFYKLHEVELGGPDPTRGHIRPVFGGEHIEPHMLFGIKAVLDRDSPIVYVTTGHGEARLTTATRFLQGDNFEVKPLNLGSESMVPVDADVVLVASPSRPMRPEALAALQSFADRGGHLLITCGRDVRETFTRLLERYGVETVPAQVGHPTAHVQAEGRYSLLGVKFMHTDEGKRPHTITSPAVREALPIYLGYSRCLRLLKDWDRTLVTRHVLARGGDSAEIVPLVFTGDAWRQARERPRPNVGDAPLMFACERRLIDDEASLTSRLVLVGSHDWLGNRPITGGFNLCNADILQNSLYWLTDEETLITGTPRSFRGRFASLDEDSRWVFFAIIIGVLPVLLMLTGGMIHVLRRRA